jgi:BlaI family penicillinase repressor
MSRKKKDVLEHHLSRRERQIMQAVYRLGSASVAEVVENIPDPPTQDAVRRLCHILEEKGLLKARPDGQRKIYSPTVDSESARRGALENLINTFFGGSSRMLVAALLDARRDELSEDEVKRLTRMLEEAEKSDKGRGRS